MALDFHIAKTQTAAMNSSPELSLTELDHRTLLMGNMEIPLSVYDLLNRLSDYYCDAEFSVEEFDELLQEMDELLEVCNHLPETVKQWQRVKACVQQAQEQQKGLWVFAD